MFYTEIVSWKKNLEILYIVKYIYANLTYKLPIEWAYIYLCIYDPFSLYM